MRLQKFLALAGVASRRKAEELIENGRVAVNGVTITRLGTTIDETQDKVTFNNKPIKLETKKVYVALHKPVGYVSSTVGNEGKSVLSLVKVKTRLYPVGRLDKDSSGLILLTNDGELTDQLTHPRYGSEKEYFIVLDRDLLPEDAKRLSSGRLTLAGKRLQPIKVVSAQNKTTRLILKEGVNRELRRVLGRLGYTVIRLKRIRIGSLELGELKEGQWRFITPEDITK